MHPKTEYMRQYRAKKPAAVQRAETKNKALRATKAQFLREYKSERGCVDCGESDWRCLDLDHVDPMTKQRMPSKLSECSWEMLLTEIAKCVVRCANCHRRRTIDERHNRVRRPVAHWLDEY